MADHDICALFDKDPTTIAKMDNTFTTHVFNQRLAKENQPFEVAYAGRV